MDKLVLNATPPSWAKREALPTELSELAAVLSQILPLDAAASVALRCGPDELVLGAELPAEVAGDATLCVSRAALPPGGALGPRDFVHVSAYEPDAGECRFAAAAAGAIEPAASAPSHWLALVAAAELLGWDEGAAPVVSLFTSTLAAQEEAAARGVDGVAPLGADSFFPLDEAMLGLLPPEPPGDGEALAVCVVGVGR